MAIKDFLLAVGGPDAEQSYRAKRERTAMDALGQYLKPGGDQAALGRAYDADPAMAMKGQAFQQEQQKTQMGLDSEQRRRVGAIAKFIHAAPEDKRPAAYMSALPVLRQTFPDQPLPDQYGPEVEQAVYGIMGLSAGDNGIGSGNGVQSTYLDADGNRVAVLRDGSMKILGAADTGMANQSVEVIGADGRTRRMTFNKRTGQYEEAGTSGSSQPLDDQPDEALIGAANSMVQTLIAQGVPNDKAGEIADQFLRQSVGQRGGQVYAGDTAPAVDPKTNQVVGGKNQFTSRTPEETTYLTEQAKNRAAREQMPYEVDQARATAQAEADAKAYADRSAVDAKRSTNANRALELLNEAEKLIPESTGSALGQVRDAGAALFGESTTGAQNIAGLNAIVGQLIAMQPRMEGPQSNYDVKLYTQMAGDLANPGLPVDTRMAALATIRHLQRKYTGNSSSQPQGGGNAQPKQSSVDSLLEKYR